MSALLIYLFKNSYYYNLQNNIGKPKLFSFSKMKTCIQDIKSTHIHFMKNVISHFFFLKNQQKKNQTIFEVTLKYIQGLVTKYKDMHRNYMFVYLNTTSQYLTFIKASRKVKCRYRTVLKSNEAKL